MFPSLSFSAVLILAQAFVADPLSSPANQTSKPPAHHQPTPASSIQGPLRLTIVNATSVPDISLTTGTNSIPDYPHFSQGTWTADEPRVFPRFRFVIKGAHDEILADRTLAFPTAPHEFLLITGDFSRNGPPEKLPEPQTVTPAITGTWPPNIQFRLFPVELVTKDPFHYRVVNAMPGKVLTLTSPAEEGKPEKLLGILTPGNSLLLTSQPANVHWIAEVDGKKIPLPLLQEGAGGNCLIPFFLKNGEPTFVRVFENP